MDESSMTSEWILAHRRSVSLTVAVLLTGLIILRVSVVGEWDARGNFLYADFARNVVDGLLSTIAVTAVLAIFFWWVRAPLTRTPVGGEIFPDQISDSLIAAARVAREWEYFGHTGKYVRSRILPVIGERSKSQSLAIAVRFIIVDPANIELCEAYADYRSRSRSSTITPRMWDAPTVQADLLATIICLVRYAARFPNLKIQLGLASHFGLWRFDRSDASVIVTQEDPQQPAYRYKNGSRFYFYHHRECLEAWRQAVRYDFVVANDEGSSDEKTMATVVRILGEPRAGQLQPLFDRAFKLADEGGSYA